MALMLVAAAGSWHLTAAMSVQIDRDIARGIHQDISRGIDPDIDRDNNGYSADAARPERMLQTSADGRYAP